MKIQMIISNILKPFFPQTEFQPSDLELMRRIFARFIDNPLVSFIDIVAYLEQNPELIQINPGTVRNESYLKALELEKS